MLSPQSTPKKNIIDVLVSRKTVKLALKCGFDISKIEYRDTNTHEVVENAKSRLSYFGNMEDANLIQRPTQSLLQKWLRDIHRIVVYVEVIGVSWNYYRAVINTESRSGEKTLWTYLTYETGQNYEEVLEIGLHEALKLIK